MTRSFTRSGASFSVRLLGAFAVAALVAAATVAGRSPSAPLRPQTTFRAGVNFVRVDVYPTSKDGRHVGDLAAADFEILENGAPQKIASFEHIVIAGPGSSAPAERVDPDSTRTEKQLTADPQNRLFVLFLDTYHVADPAADRGGPVSPADARTPLPPRRRDGPPLAITLALTRFLERVIGPDDLVGLMTPEMDARQVVFVRRPSSIEEFLNSTWARRFDTENADLEEQRLIRCGLGRDALDRRREEQTLRAVRDLVEHLHGVRDERKAVILVSEGWLLYRPDNRIAQPSGTMPLPGPQGIYVGPDGKPRTGDDDRNLTPDMQECARERFRLSLTDDEGTFRELLDEANRANTSFYPVDPRGLAAFDAPFAAGALQSQTVPRGKDAGLDAIRDALARSGLTPQQVESALKGSAVADFASLRARLDTMSTLADATDGVTLLSNDLNRVLQRIADDLSAYYLIGYSSTNAKADGTYRAITVRVKRPGVDVRARRGYRAVTRQELEASRTAPGAVSPDSALEPLREAIAGLSSFRPAVPFEAEAGQGCASRGSDGGGWTRSVWVLGEITAAGRREAAWQSGATVDITIAGADGRTIGAQQTRLSSTQYAFLAPLPFAVPPGEQIVTIAARPAGGSGLTMKQTLRVLVAAPSAESAPCIGTALMARRGPFTGNSFQPTTDARFRRQERVRVEVPVSGNVEAFTATLLDRAGKPIAVPVTSGERRDESGWRWIAGEAALAPLAPGEYVIQLEVPSGATRQKVLRAIRIIP